MFVDKCGTGNERSFLVPCGKCPACLALYQMQWSFRLEQEALYGGHASTLFVTFTYDNEHLPEDFGVHKDVVMKYLHDLRQNLDRRYGYDIFVPFDYGFVKKHVNPILVKYFFCAEYGSKRGRPHYHALLFFNKSIDWLIIQRSWNKGIVDIRPFSSARAGYVAKYSVKQLNLDYDGRPAPFHLQSNGLGKCFLEGKSLETLKYQLYWKNLSGRSVKLPRYYIDSLGSWRSRYRWKDDVGNVYTRSFTYHKTSYVLTKGKSMRDFYQRDSISRQKFGNTYVSYDLYLRNREINLEHSLVRNFENNSSYWKLSRIGK